MSDSDVNSDSTAAQAKSALEAVLILPEAPMLFLGSLCRFHRTVLKPAPPAYVPLATPYTCSRCKRVIRWAETGALEFAGEFASTMTLLSDLAEVAR